jgi:hypothetical protein
MPVSTLFSRCRYRQSGTLISRVLACIEVPGQFGARVRVAFVSPEFDYG